MIDNVNTDRSEQKKRTLKPLVSEILRPQALSELVLPMQTIHGLQRLLQSGSMANMVLYGPPGTGKTSTARILMKAIGGGLEINRSSDTSPKLAKVIETYATRVGAKICFVDEAHCFSKNDQKALPGLIDRLTCNCRFLFAATDISKLIPELRSGLKKVSFDMENCLEVQKRLMERYENILSANGFTFDKVRLERIIEAKFPDLRAIANNIEFEFA